MERSRLLRLFHAVREFVHGQPNLGRRGLLGKRRLAAATLPMKAALKGTSGLLGGCNITPCAGSVFLGLKFMELVVPERNPELVMLDFPVTCFHSIEQSLPKAKKNMCKLIRRGGSRGGENGWDDLIKSSFSNGSVGAMALRIAPSSAIEVGKVENLEVQKLRAWGPRPSLRCLGSWKERGNERPTGRRGPLDKHCGSSVFGGQGGGGRCRSMDVAGDTTNLLEGQDIDVLSGQQGAKLAYTLALSEGVEGGVVLRADVKRVFKGSIA